MNKRLTEYDCSDITPNLESINNLNRYFQINSISDIEFKVEQLGQPHEPIFWTTATFEDCEFSAHGRTKKDCEKKIRTYLWKLISEEILVIDQRVKKQVKNGCKTPNFHPFAKFKQVLDQELNKERPMLLVDVENLGEKALTDQQFKSICNSYNIGVICVCSRVVPDNDGDLVVIRRDDLHKDSADEGIRRIVYYLMDHLGFTKIGLMTRDHFGQNLKDVLNETDQKFVFFRDIEEFNTKYFRLIQGGNSIHENGRENKEPEIVSSDSSSKGKPEN